MTFLFGNTADDESSSKVLEDEYFLNPQPATGSEMLVCTNARHFCTTTVECQWNTEYILLYTQRDMESHFNISQVCYSILSNCRHPTVPLFGLRYSMVDLFKE